MTNEFTHRPSNPDEDSTVFEMYCRLWRTAEAMGVRVQYSGIIDETAGCFHPNPHGAGSAEPLIEIGREYYDQIDQPARHRNAAGQQHRPDPDLLAETITLAHELGHFLSWKERHDKDWAPYQHALQLRDASWERVPTDGSVREYNDALRAAARETLSDEQMRLILEEEERAWEHARRALTAASFPRMDAFEDAARRGLHYHRYRLGLEELWPEDVE